MKQQKTKKSLSVFKLYWRLFPAYFKYAPVLVVVCLLINVLHGVFWGVQTLFQQKFFDSAANLASGETLFINTVISLFALAVVNITCQVLNGVGNYLPSVLEAKVLGKLTFNIHQKIAKLNPIDFEDTNKLDDINKAEKGKNSSLGFVFIITTIFTFYIPYFLFMAWYLFTLKPIFPIAILIIFVPTVLTQIIRAKVFTKVEDKSAPVRRENEYYEGCIIKREYFKETRLLGGFVFFKDLFVDTLKSLQKLEFKATFKTNMIELLMKLVTVGGYFAIIYMLFDALMKQEISVGAFAAVFDSIGMIHSIMEEVICRHIGYIAKDIGTIRNYVNFLDLPERNGEDIDVNPNSDIILKDVSFSYPNSDKQAIKNISFTLKQGETLAIVGENGSGKSTIINLITGIYTPSNGSVLYGNIDTKDLSMKSLFHNTSGVFQKYQRYQMKLNENITISDTSKEQDKKTLDSICKTSGVDLSDPAFTNGYDTMLSREFDGVDLSGGQWQRIAIARGFYKTHHLIVLDEPTAAIDPFEEKKIYERFAEISKDKTAIIVTHRLGSVKLADRIIVMKEGEIAQIGTHEELINQEGEYAKLYSSQEQWYKDKSLVS